MYIHVIDDKTVKIIKTSKCKESGNTDSPERSQTFVQSHLIIAIPGRVSPRIPELEDNFVGAFFNLWVECAEPSFLSQLIFGLPGF
jgi:hypothetical protein